MVLFQFIQEIKQEKYLTLDTKKSRTLKYLELSIRYRSFYLPQVKMLQILTQFLYFENHTVPMSLLLNIDHKIAFSINISDITHLF